MPLHGHKLSTHSSGLVVLLVVMARIQDSNRGAAQRHAASESNCLKRCEAHTAGQKQAVLHVPVLLGCHSWHCAVRCEQCAAAMLHHARAMHAARNVSAALQAFGHSLVFIIMISHKRPFRAEVC